MQIENNNETSMNSRINPSVRKGRMIISKIKQLKRFFIVVFLCLIGGTSSSDATAFTFGFDHQYRYNIIWGLGFETDYVGEEFSSFLIEHAGNFDINSKRHKDMKQSKVINRDYLWKGMMASSIVAINTVFAREP